MGQPRAALHVLESERRRRGVQAAAATLVTLFIMFDLLASGTAVLRLQSAVACSRSRSRSRSRFSRASLLRRCRLAPTHTS